MPIHLLKLIDRYPIARNTLLFKFEKPQGLHFIPGQYAGFTLINPPETDSRGLTRRFSLLSSPDDDYIAIATRVQDSAFKRVLIDLPLGEQVKFAGPTGTFILHENPMIPAVLLAGGIGIAPFYSMIAYASKHHSHQQIYLFYGNKTVEDAPLLTELVEFQTQNPHFRLIATLDHSDPAWSNESGLISPTMIKKYIKDITLPYYYICGSPVMVTALQEMLAEMDINEDNIKVEDFPGY